MVSSMVSVMVKRTEVGASRFLSWAGDTPWNCGQPDVLLLSITCGQLTSAEMALTDTTMSSPAAALENAAASSSTLVFQSLPNTVSSPFHKFMMTSLPPSCAHAARNEQVNNRNVKIFCFIFFEFRFMQHFDGANLPMRCFPAIPHCTFYLPEWVNETFGDLFYTNWEHKGCV